MKKGRHTRKHHAHHTSKALPSYLLPPTIDALQLDPSLRTAREIVGRHENRTMSNHAIDSAA